MIFGKIGNLPRPRGIAPAHAAFFGSLLLSAIAVLANPTLNRDGILYVETARIFLQEGLSASIRSFNWPFLSILMALISKLTGLSFENSGHLLNAFFMAGTCTLVVASVERDIPAKRWLTCMVVLALPGFNQYRNELIREFGYWFFCVLSFWIAIASNLDRSWKRYLLGVGALCAAALFRAEALILFLALSGWFFAKKLNTKWTAAIGVLLFAACLLVLNLTLRKDIDLGNRLSGFIGYFDVVNRAALFKAKAAILSGALIPYAQPNAAQILFTGSLMIVPMKFLSQLSIFIIPLIWALKSPPLRASVSHAKLFLWATAAHVIVLAAFVVNNQFLAGRYVATLSVFCASLAGIGTWQLWQSHPKLRKPAVAICALFMAANVISLNSGSSARIDAGKWLAENVANSSRIYVEDTRITYYAGWNRSTAKNPIERETLGTQLRDGKFDMVVLDIAHNTSAIESWLSDNNMLVIQRFKGRKSGDIIIARKALAQQLLGGEKRQDD